GRVPRPPGRAGPPTRPRAPPLDALSNRGRCAGTRTAWSARRRRRATGTTAGEPEGCPCRRPSRNGRAEARPGRHRSLPGSSTRLLHHRLLDEQQPERAGEVGQVLGGTLRYLARHVGLEVVARFPRQLGDPVVWRVLALRDP